MITKRNDLDYPVCNEGCPQTVGCTCSLEVPPLIAEDSEPVLQHVSFNCSCRSGYYDNVCSSTGISIFSFFQSLF